MSKVMSIEPKLVFWDRCSAVKTALRDWQQLILELSLEPTSVVELVPGEAAYKGTLNASGEGAGGVWVIVWRGKFPPEVATRLITEDNPADDITNSDLEMVAEVLGWLVLEANVCTIFTHVVVCSDN